jgi:hypothetical protein
VADEDYDYKVAEIDYKVAEIHFLEAHLRHRAVICLSMVVAGIICLAAGIAMLVVGLRGDQVIWFQSGNLKVTAGGFGAVTMLASVAWGFVAYSSRPEVQYRSPQLEFTLREQMQRMDGVARYVAERKAAKEKGEQGAPRK